MIELIIYSFSQVNSVCISRRRKILLDGNQLAFKNEKKIEEENQNGGEERKESK